MAKAWGFYCPERRHHGLWKSWFREQCVTVGWSPREGNFLRGKPGPRSGWSRARKCLEKIAPGDQVVVCLPDSRIARIGEVFAKKVDDHEWHPIIRSTSEPEGGKMGRRVLVRWNPAAGPPDQNTVVRLPKNRRFSTSSLRQTIFKIEQRKLTQLKEIARNEANWVRLHGQFNVEKFLSDYIAEHPDRFKDGLETHGRYRVREYRMKNGRRIDILLMDRSGGTVIVECKKGVPSASHVQQLRNYVNQFMAESDEKDVRGILVHGGSGRLAREVATAARRRPRIETVRYSLNVDFARSGG
jgi:hypothetical protein